MKDQWFNYAKAKCIKLDAMTQAEKSGLSTEDWQLFITDDEKEFIDNNSNMPSTSGLREVQGDELWEPNYTTVIPWEIISDADGLAL